MENTYRAANIALIDEWGVFAENIGVDIFEIIDAIRDRPTHSNIRQPGFGVGGYCLTKDPLLPILRIIHFSKEQCGVSRCRIGHDNKQSDANKKFESYSFNC